MTLKFAHGPRLTYKSSSMKKKKDVTTCGHEFLFDEVELADDVTLADIFWLLDASPLLVEVFNRDFARELLAEAIKGPLKPKKCKESDRIEFLELFSQWDQDTSNDTISGNNRLCLRGVGPILKKANREYGAKAGERQKLGLSFAPFRELLSLPIQINLQTPVYESDVDAFLCNKELRVIRQEAFTLGEVIHGVLWELSFFGTPSQSAKLCESLLLQVHDLKAGTLKTVSDDEMFEGFYRPGVDAMFSTISDHKASDISWALRGIKDDGNVPDALRETFGESVVVKDKYKNFQGREFRRAFRLAKKAKSSNLK